MTKTVTTNGTTFRIRYSYKREDGTLWHVLDTNGEPIAFLFGEFGDEFPVT